MDPSTEQVNSNECQVLLAAIKAIQDANTESHKDLHDLIKNSIKGVQENIDANAEVTHLHLKTQTGHLEKLNGSVADLYIKHGERGKVVKEFYEHKRKYEKLQKTLDWAKRRWYVVVGLFFVAMGIVEFIMEVVGFKRLINAIWDKI